MTNEKSGGSTALVPRDETDMVPVGEQGVETPGQEPQENFRRTETIKEERLDEETIDATITTMARCISYTNRDASNGANIDATFEIDAVYAGDFTELIGELSFEIVIDKVSCGEARVLSVGTKADADNAARTKLGLKWPADQRKRAVKINDFVGQTRRLSLFQLQIPVFGAKS